MLLLMTVAECDSALKRARAIPDDERGPMWQQIVDEVLDRRASLATVDANLRDIRVMRAKELR